MKKKNKSLPLLQDVFNELGIPHNFNHSGSVSEYRIDFWFDSYVSVEDVFKYLTDFIKKDIENRAYFDIKYKVFGSEITFKNQNFLGLKGVEFEFYSPYADKDFIEKLNDFVFKEKIDFIFKNTYNHKSVTNKKNTKNSVYDFGDSF